MPWLFKLLGALGLLFITAGVFKRQTSQALLFAVGGGLLLIYSLYLRDPVFIPLQLVFIGSSLYQFHQLKKIAHPPIN